MRDITTRRLEYDRLRKELMKLAMTRDGMASRRYEEVHTCLRKMLAEDGVKRYGKTDS